MGGKLQSTSTTITEGKNVGRANETTPWEQCQLEAESLWTNKRDRRGYSETVPTGKQDKKLRPMLAKTYEAGKVKYPAFAQPKLDGIRCIATLQKGGFTLQSRQGKEFVSLGHLHTALQSTFDKCGEVILDGELYNHELKNDFQKIVSAIKRDKPSSDTSLIQYHVYDVINDDDFYNRNRFLKKNLQVNKNVKLVTTLDIDNHDHLLERYQSFMGDGYEGAIVRHLSGKYEIDKRSSNLLKFKEFMDDEFVIVGAIENKGKQEGQCSLICKTKKGTEFAVKPKGTEQEREQYWNDWQAGKLKGKLLTVRFFSWTTSEQPVPRFPIGVGVRDYEN